MKYFLLMIILSLSPLSAAWGQIQQTSTCAIDWSAMRIYATGQGFSGNQARNSVLGKRMAERAALLDARRNLLELFLAVRVDSQTLVRDFFVQSDVAYNRLAGALVGSSLDELEERKDGGVEVRISAPLMGEVARALWELYPPETASVRPAGTSRRQVLQNGPTSAVRGPVLRDASPGYTGIIIDARNLNFRPSLRPALYGPDGMLYPSSAVPRDLATQKGYACYFRDLETAAASGRCGDDPLVLRASRLHKGQNSSLELEQAAARQLQKLAGGAGAPLLQAAVTIVY